MKKSMTDWVVDLTGLQYGFYDEPAMLLQDFEKATGTHYNEFEKLKHGWNAENPLHKHPETNEFMGRVVELGYQTAQHASDAILRSECDGLYICDSILENDVQWRRAEAMAIGCAKKAIEEDLEYLHEKSRILKKDEHGQSVFTLQCNRSVDGQMIINFDDGKLTKNEWFMLGPLGEKMWELQEQGVSAEEIEKIYIREKARATKKASSKGCKQKLLTERKD